MSAVLQQRLRLPTGSSGEGASAVRSGRLQYEQNTSPFSTLFIVPWQRRAGKRNILRLNRQQDRSVHMHR